MQLVESRLQSLTIFWSCAAAEDFCIEKVEFEDKLNKVIVRGKFSGEKLSKKICYKADRIVKDITIDCRGLAAAQAGGA